MDYLFEMGTPVMTQKLIKRNYADLYSKSISITDKEFWSNEESQAREYYEI